MKLKPNFVLRQIADMWVVMAIGVEATNFNGMITLNDTGAFLWHILEQGGNIEAMADAIIEEYNIPRDVALVDAQAFCQRLTEIGCLEK